MPHLKPGMDSRLSAGIRAANSSASLLAQSASGEDAQSHEENSTAETDRAIYAKTAMCWSRRRYSGKSQGAWVALPCGAVVCLVAAFKAWIRAAGITAAPMFSPAAKGEVT